MFIVSKKNKQDLKYEQYEQYEHIYLLFPEETGRKEVRCKWQIRFEIEDLGCL